MKNQKYISSVFGLIVSLLIGLGGFSLFYLNKISENIEMLYKHPYTVSNAVRDIDTHIVSMHRYMKDVALADDLEEIKLASSLVDTHELEVLKNFELVFNRYLGSRSDIGSAYKAFVSWKVIRDEVIFLKTNGEDKKAAFITKNKGADHIKLLTDETRKLIDYADDKAKVFLERSIKSKSEAFIYVIGLLSAAVFISVLLSYYTVRHLVSAESEISNRMELIDQNILMAKMDLHGVIEDISNQLCRYLKITKKEMKGKQSNFFIDPKLCFINTDDIYNMTETGKAWQGEIELLNSHGEHYWIDSVVHPNFDSNSGLTGYTNIIQDITDRKALEMLSITDSLTKLSNRRHFDDMIGKEIKISRKNGVSLVFAMIDIDFFKRFNDHYGHHAGDIALIKVAGALRKSLNYPNGYVFRIGGEEFGILFSGVDIKKTEIFLEKIRAVVENLRIEHVESDVSDFVTVSLGAVIDTENVLESSDIYIKADELLYKAKLSRNKVVVSSLGFDYLLDDN